MRDRGVLSPDDLRGCSRRELEYTAMAMKAKRTSYETFDEALDDAIALDWIESYEAGEELFYLPNYRRNANPTV